MCRIVIYMNIKYLYIYINIYIYIYISNVRLEFVILRLYGCKLVPFSTQHDIPTSLSGTPHGDLVMSRYKHPPFLENVPSTNLKPKIA